VGRKDRKISMGQTKPIATAPMDGRKVRIVWTDADGQENESIGQYRSLERMRGTGGDWDESDAGWWVFVDGSTQKKVTPHSWIIEEDEE
jgi:hypothetical protein